MINIRHGQSPGNRSHDPAPDGVLLQTSDFPNVRCRLRDLEAGELASVLTILPQNFDIEDRVSDLFHVPGTATVKGLLREHGLPYEDLLPKENRPPYLHLRSADWHPPVLFFAYALTQDPALVLSVLEIVANYAAKATRGVARRRRAKLQIVAERNDEGSCTKIDYEGPADKIDDLLKIIHDPDEDCDSQDENDHGNEDRDSEDEDSHGDEA